MSVESVIIIILFIVFYGAIFLFSKLSYKDGYKHGQADALSGIQKYHLLEFKNGERDWYEKKILEKNDFTDEYKDFKVIL